MDNELNYERLMAAYERVRDDLLGERSRDGHWTGELSTSALSTATAVSALTIVERHDATNDAGRFANEARESFISEFIIRGINWLADHQNSDGGWGDTDKSHSNIATTMLAVAAFHLTGVPIKHADALERAQKYIDDKGGINGLRKRYGKDKTFAVPILTNCALAELVPWSKVPALPFEMACLPQEWYRFLRLPVVSYAIPALVAIGQCRYHHLKPWNPLSRMIRARCVEPSLDVLHKMQPASGGFLEAIPLTSFVVMSLASIGRVDHPVTQAGLEFIVDSVREDGSWPIDTDLATWNTTLAVNALAGAGEDVNSLGCLDWILKCQYVEPHPYTGAAPGGWGWSDLSGAVPDADDTPGALLALAHHRDAPDCDADTRSNITSAAQRGARWLLDLQNADGGWPTFCRGWGKLPFDRSGADLTAHAIRALTAWREDIDEDQYKTAIENGVRYLLKQQRTDGEWVPLWFGNQDDPHEDNPVYGTAKVLIALVALRETTGGWGRSEAQPPEQLAAGSLRSTPATQNRNGRDQALRRGVQWLVQRQNADGGWGGKVFPGQDAQKRPAESSVEETALAVEALLAVTDGRVSADGLAFSGEQHQEQTRRAIEHGLGWLVGVVEENKHRETSPIGFYFAKLWYYERLYPIIFTASALGQAVGPFVPPASRTPHHAHQ